MRNRGMNVTLLERKKEPRTMDDKARGSKRARRKHQDWLSRWYRLATRYAARRRHKSRMFIDGDVEEMQRDNVIGEAQFLHRTFSDMWEDMVRSQTSHRVETPEWLCTDLHEGEVLDYSEQEYVDVFGHLPISLYKCPLTGRQFPAQFDQNPQCP